jgi:hypothetical protein
MDLWNHKARSYIRLAGSPYPTEALQYEGVLEDPSSVIRNILERHSLPLRGADIENVH